MAHDKECTFAVPYAILSEGMAAHTGISTARIECGNPACTDYGCLDIAIGLHIVEQPSLTFRYRTDVARLFAQAIIEQCDAQDAERKGKVN